jgi:hypothetical protein
LKIDDELKPRIISAIDAVMRHQSKCDFGINIDDPETSNLLFQSKGKIERRLILQNEELVTCKVTWNKKELFFACSVAFLKKHGGKLQCQARFDDAHDSRHFDADFSKFKAKMFGGDFTEAKAQCPVLNKIINSLPKASSDEWKLKLFLEIVLGNQRRKESPNNPNRIIPK